MFAIRLEEFLLFGLAPLFLSFVALPDAVAAEERMIEGEITYRERIALPAQAMVTVELADVSHAEGPAAVLGRQEIRGPIQAPVKFTLRFDPWVIRPEAAYALQARITVDNELWFSNEMRYEAHSASPVELVLNSSR